MSGKSMASKPNRVGTVPKTHRQLQRHSISASYNIAEKSLSARGHRHTRKHHSRPVETSLTLGNDTAASNSPPRLTIAERFMSRDYTNTANSEKRNSRDDTPHEQIVEALNTQPGWNQSLLLLQPPPIWDRRVHPLPTIENDSTPQTESSEIRSHSTKKLYEHSKNLENQRERRPSYSFSGDYTTWYPPSKKRERKVAPESVSDVWMECCCCIRCGHTSKSYRTQPPESKKKLLRIRRRVAIAVFCVTALLALLTFLFWPRTPLMRVEGISLLVPANITQSSNTSNVQNIAFESSWMINVTIDNSINYIPTRINAVDVLVKDSQSGLLIGNDFPFPAASRSMMINNAITTIQLPVHVTYQARDMTDITLAHLVKACAPSVAERQPLQLQLLITLHIFGLDWLGYKPTIVAESSAGEYVR